MKLPKKPKPDRHPAVIDTLGAATTKNASTARTSAHAGQARRAVRRISRPPNKIAVPLGILGAALAAAGVFGFTDATTDTSTQPVGTAETAVPSSTGPSPGGCRAEPGDQSTGEAAIRAFEHAYYVTRSGVEARKMAAPSSSVMPAEALQPVIDAIPAATTYCLQTTSIGADAYIVVLTENRPGQQPQKWTQTVTTTQIDGRWYVDQFQ